MFGVDLALIGDIDMCQLRWGTVESLNCTAQPPALGEGGGREGGHGQHSICPSCAIQCSLQATISLVPPTPPHHSSSSTLAPTPHAPSALRLTPHTKPSSPPRPINPRYFANIVEQRLEHDDSVLIMTHEPIWLLEWYAQAPMAANLRQLVRCRVWVWVCMSGVFLCNCNIELFMRLSMQAT